MLWSRLFIPTLRDDPAEARNAAHRLLIRAAYMRRQDYLFLGRRALRKIAEIVRREMGASGAQEMRFSSPRSPLAIAAEIRSYKQLPQIWYQFHEFAAECWSFGDREERAAHAVRRILDACSLEVIGGGREFVALSESGNPILLGGAYAASVETAGSRAQPPAIADPEGHLAPEPFSTPGQKTIADLAAFTGLPETSQMKSVVMVADRKTVLVMLRGDHQLSEAKLLAALAAAELRPANAEEIRSAFGADAGSLGPVGVRNVRILADEALRGRRNMICGANRNDSHLRHVTPGEDFSPEFHDLRMAAEGEESILDGARLEAGKGIVLARFEALRDAGEVTGEAGGPSRLRVQTGRLFLDSILSAAVEQHHDPDGIALPAAIAPFAAVITPVANEEAQQRAARDLYDALCAMGIDVLLDDRDERPGVKFKDADLIGVPFRVTFGKKLAQGLVEIRNRRARASEDVPVGDAVSFVKERLWAAGHVGYYHDDRLE